VVEAEFKQSMLKHAINHYAQRRRILTSTTNIRLKVYFFDFLRFYYNTNRVSAQIIY